MKNKGFIILTSGINRPISSTGAYNLYEKFLKENPEAFYFLKNEKDLEKFIFSHKLKVTSELKRVIAGQYWGYYFECELG